MISKYTLLISLLLLTSFSLPSLAHDNDRHYELSQDAQKEIVKIGKNGFLPAKQILSKRDASVFFLNTLSDSLVTLVVNFGSKRAHCASSNMSFNDGVLKSIKPLGPKDFAILCFPDAGEYEVLAYGIAGSSKPVIGKIVVE